MNCKEEKKIAFVCNISLMAGAQRIAFEIMKGMPKNWKKYIFVGLDENGKDEFEQCFKTIGVKVIYVNGLRRDISKEDIFVFFELFKIFRHYKFDIVHTHSTKPGVIGRIAAKLAGAGKVIHTVHGVSYNKSEPIVKRIIYYAIESIATLFGSKLILVNNYYYKYYKIFNMKGNVVTIHNGVDFEKLTQVEGGGDNSLSDIENKKHILFVGRLDLQKSPMTILKAMSYIKEFYPDVYQDVIVDIAGDGELAQVCKEYVFSNNLSGTVRFHGWVSGSKKKSLYERAYLFCCPSIFEAFGLVFVEAAYYGLPVVSTNVEGIPEVVSNGISGILVEPGNYVEVAMAIIKIVKSEELSKFMGNNAFNICTQKFDVNKMIGKYMKVYNE